MASAPAASHSLAVAIASARVMPPGVRWRVLDAVKSHGVLQLRAQVSEITRNEVLWTDKAGAEQRTAADSVVLAIGAEADDAVAVALADCGVPLQRIGDCAGVNYIEGAMHEGHRAGREV